MRIVTAATLALVALLSLFPTATATPFGDALGEVSRAMSALREADVALANLEKHVGLLGASDAEVRQSLDLTLAVIADYVMDCGDRLIESRRLVPVSKWTAPKPGKSADYWSSINDEEQFRVIGFTLFQGNTE
jgi:lauroyl/myristoyl acyltransferase